MISNAPIVLFVYKRLLHTQKTVEALQRDKEAQDSVLFIFSDGPKFEKEMIQVKNVRNYIKTIIGFKEIHISESENNLGLANSVINGVTKIINEYKKIIVLEDDIICSPGFLKFMNESLSFYENEKGIISVTGFKHPIKFPENYNSDVFISPRPSSWGWGTWLDRWEKVDWDIKDFNEFRSNKNLKNMFNKGGKDLTPMLFSQMRGTIDSWAIRWTYFHFRSKGYCLYPRFSLIKNIGADNSGTHTNKTDKFNVVLSNSDKKINMSNNLVLNNDIIREQISLYEPSFLRKIINKVKFG
jgi:hypothetical protein